MTLAAGIILVVGVGVVMRVRQQRKNFIWHFETLESLLKLRAYDHPLIGECLGDYRVIGVLEGDGQAGHLRAVPDRSLDLSKSVAVEVRWFGSSGDKERREFGRESELLVCLRHPNIAAVHGWGLEPQWYRVVDLVEGQTLDDWRHAEQSILAALDVSLQVLDALAFAHSCGVMHHNLCPRCISVQRGKVKLREFGRPLVPIHLAHPTDLGLPSYMSPEMISASGGQLDGATDQYGAGCIICELLTGQPPYPSGDVMQVLMGHLSQPAPSLRERRPELSAELDSAVRKMLEKRPEDRYPDLASAAAAIRRCLP